MSRKRPSKTSDVIHIQGKPVILYDYHKYTSLLDALEQNKIKIHSECKDGYCGSCKIKLSKGSVYYTKTPLANLDSDECLPCCCVPDGDININLE